MAHTLTIDQVGEIDMAFQNAADPAGMLRLVDHRVSGNRIVTLLEVPGDNSAPTYQRVNGHFQHIAGPAYPEWQSWRMYLELQSTYRDERDTIRSLREGLHW